MQGGGGWEGTRPTRARTCPQARGGNKEGREHCRATSPLPPCPPIAVPGEDAPVWTAAQLIEDPARVSRLGISLGFVLALIEYFRGQRCVHRKYAIQVRLGVCGGEMRGRRGMAMDVYASQVRGRGHCSSGRCGSLLETPCLSPSSLPPPSAAPAPADAARWVQVPRARALPARRRALQRVRRHARAVLRHAAPLLAGRPAVAHEPLPLQRGLRRQGLLLRRERCAGGSPACAPVLPSCTALLPACCSADALCLEAPAARPRAPDARK